MLGGSARERENARNNPHGLRDLLVAAHDWEFLFLEEHDDANRMRVLRNPIVHKGELSAASRGPTEAPPTAVIDDG